MSIAPRFCCLLPLSVANGARLPPPCWATVPGSKRRPSDRTTAQLFEMAHTVSAPHGKLPSTSLCCPIPPTNRCPAGLDPRMIHNGHAFAHCPRRECWQPMHIHRRNVQCPSPLHCPDPLGPTSTTATHVQSTAPHRRCLMPRLLSSLFAFRTFGRNGVGGACRRAVRGTGDLLQKFFVSTLVPGLSMTIAFSYCSLNRVHKLLSFFVFALLFLFVAKVMLLAQDITTLRTWSR
jgi:hypothetical protein